VVLWGGGGFPRKAWRGGAVDRRPGREGAERGSRKPGVSGRQDVFRHWPLKNGKDRGGESWEKSNEGEGRKDFSGPMEGTALVALTGGKGGERRGRASLPRNLIIGSKI